MALFALPFASGGSSVHARTLPFILGADVSWIPEEEARGVNYFDSGVRKDIFQILKDHKFNFIRLRLFNNPRASSGGSVATTGAVYAGYDSLGPGFCDLAHTKAMALRIKAAGMQCMLDFHYSDNWADPGKQYKPHAWASATFSQLTDSVRQFTYNTLVELKNQGTLPAMVQVGNEITAGMIWPEGAANNWDSLAALLKAAVAGVKAVDSSVKIAVHLDKGGDFGATRRWLDSARARGVAFDILGESCYANFQGDSADWKAAFDSLALYYPQYSFLIAEYSQEKRAANDIMYHVPNEKGLGSFIWEPLQYGEAVFTAAGNNWSANSFIDLYPQMSKEYGNDTLPSSINRPIGNPLQPPYAVVNGAAWLNGKAALRCVCPATTTVVIELFNCRGKQLLFASEEARTGTNTFHAKAPQQALPTGWYVIVLRSGGEVRAMQQAVRVE